MGRFGLSFLNDASQRLQNLLHLDGQVSASPDMIEKLQSVILVGDATQPGLSNSGRHFGISTVGQLAAGGAVGTFMPWTEDVIIETIMIQVTAAALLTLRVTVWAPGESATGTMAQSGRMLDAYTVGERSPMAFAADGATGSEMFRFQWAIGTYPPFVINLAKGFFMSKGTSQGQGARLNFDCSGVGNGISVQLIGRVA